MQTETVDAIAETAPPPEIPREDRPIHLAKCAECATAVQFYRSASGNGFTLIDPMPDVMFGIGPQGNPLCPHGHGEMAIADDALPAAEAFALAAEQLDAARQARLPLPIPAFNYEGVLRTIVEKRHVIAVLERKVDDRKDALKRAKDELEDANKHLGQMIDEFERNEQDRKDEIERRAADAARGVVDGARLVTCAWVSANPDGGTCLLCEAVPLVKERILGNPEFLAAPDAQAHIDDVERYIIGLEVEEAQQALESIDTYVHPGVIHEWTAEDRKAVTIWADYQDDLANGIAQSESEDFTPPSRPEVLGKPHIPEDPTAIDGVQRCSICAEKLPIAGGSYLYAVTDLVGTDCSGRAPKEEARYPKRKSGKGKK